VKMGQWKSENAEYNFPSSVGVLVVTFILIMGENVQVGLNRSTTADGDKTQPDNGWIVLDGMLAAPFIRITRGNP
jgi:hypothetical protein